MPAFSTSQQVHIDHLDAKIAIGEYKAAGALAGWQVDGHGTGNEHAVHGFFIFLAELSLHFPGHFQWRKILLVGGDGQVIQRRSGVVVHLQPDGLNAVYAQSHAKDVVGIAVTDDAGAYGQRLFRMLRGAFAQSVVVDDAGLKTACGSESEKAE